MVNSKDKGKRGEREWAEKCREHGFTEAKRGQQYHGLEGEDVVGLPQLWQEVKWVERLNIHDAIEQAVNDSGDRIPIVAHKKNRKPWLVTMLADDWFEFYRKYLEEGGGE